MCGIRYGTCLIGRWHIKNSRLVSIMHCVHCRRPVDVLITRHSWELTYTQPHISSVIGSCFYQLRRMKSSLKLFPFDTASTVVNSFIISRTDYCNSLLANSSQCALNRLQRVMNAAVRLLCHSGRRASVSGLLRDRLHWLRVPERGEYKVSSDFQGPPWHGSESSEWALPTKRRRHCSFSTSLCSMRRSPSSTQQDELWKPCIRCRRADVLEQTSSRNPGKWLAAEFQVSA